MKFDYKDLESRLGKRILFYNPSFRKAKDIFEDHKYITVNAPHMDSLVCVTIKEEMVFVTKLGETVKETSKKPSALQMPKATGKSNTKQSLLSTYVNKPV